MGVGESLKGVYYSGEEKWYNFLDKVDEHIPVYKIIDPIDEIFPSFALFLILIFVLLLALILGFAGFVGLQQSTLKLSVVDGQGNAVSGAQVEIQGINDTYYSNEFGLVPDIVVPFGAAISVKAKKGTIESELPLIIDELIKIEEISLAGLNIEFKESKVIQFLTETGTRATGKITLNFECSNYSSEVPERRDIYDGTTSVEVSSECGTLTATITSEKYKTRTAVIDKPSNPITLEDAEIREIARAIINLRSTDSNAVNGVTVYAYSLDNFLGEQDTSVSVNGTAIFDLPEGEYRFDTKMEQGYKPAQSAIVTLSKNQPKQVEINLQKNFVGLIKVEVKEGATKLSGVRVALMKGTSEMLVQTTDANGYVQYELTEQGLFKIIGSKDGYCIASIDANVPSNIILSMIRNNGQCGGNLKVKVIDQDNKPVPFAKAIIFGEKETDAYKLGYIEKLTNYDGNASWSPVSYSLTGETYKVFAYKGTYSGWSTAREFTPQNASEEFVVKLEIPLGKVIVNVKDNDGNPLQFSEVQLFGDYDKANITGKRIIEDADGKIEFNVKAGRRVYAVVKKEGYESYTTIPKQMIGSGTISYNVVLSRPPVEQLRINYLGLYKDDSLALRAEPGKEYTAMFEIIAPTQYEELGFFVRVGKDNVTKSELDKLYIKEIIAPGISTILTGGSYNKPKGYSIDEEYLNLEQSKWGQAKWEIYNYVPGKIIVGAKIKIKENAQPNEQLIIAYRAWGVDFGSYERDIIDAELGTAQSNSIKQELYAATKEAYAWVGTEALCESAVDGSNNTFCVTATYTDPDGFTNSFDTGFDAKNNTPYNVAIKIMSASSITFEKAKIKIENPEENIYMENYTIITPTNAIKNGTINGYASEWIDAPNFSPNTSISISSLNITPRKVGAGTIKIRIRDDSSLVFEKVFTITVGSDKKMKVQYMYANKFQDEMPKLVSGKPELITVKVFNTENNLEIENAVVKLYDRFGSMLILAKTNKLGVATINVPASLPGEKLKLQIEKSEYETLVKYFNISEDVVEVTPADLSFTLNPQTAVEDSQTVKIENKTGLDLTIKEIKLVGKFKGLISEAQTESWFSALKGTKIASNDYLEAQFKVFIGRVVPQADDLEGTFQIIVGNEYNSWIKEIKAKIRIGLGQDVDNPSCLEITKADWKATTQGKEVEVAFDVVNNCTADAQLVLLKNLGARNETAGNNLGTMSVQSNPGYAELSRSYNRIFRKEIGAGEKIPITLKFVPFGGVNGTATGKILFEAENLTDSKNQKIGTELTYTIDIINLTECLVVGADLIKIEPNGTGSFSVTNNCPVKADMEIESELQTSDKLFTLNSNETKDVTIARNEGDLPGAYNILVKGRQGNDRQQLLGNVKAILDADGCITLSRYEYDVYDSPLNEFDGVDRGYLRNNCTQKNIGIQVEGTEPYDKERVFQQAILGAIIGYFKSDCTSFFGKLTGYNCKGDNNKWVDESEKNLSVAKEKAFKDLKNATKAEATRILTEMRTQQALVDGNVVLAKQKLNTTKAATLSWITKKYKENLAECGNCIDISEKRTCEIEATKLKDAAVANLEDIVKAKEKLINDETAKVKSATDAMTPRLNRALSKSTTNNDARKAELERKLLAGEIGSHEEIEAILKQEEYENETKLSDEIKAGQQDLNKAYESFNKMIKDNKYYISQKDQDAFLQANPQNINVNAICKSGLDTTQGTEYKKNLDLCWNLLKTNYDGSGYYDSDKKNCDKDYTNVQINETSFDGICCGKIAPTKVDEPTPVNPPTSTPDVIPPVILAPTAPTTTQTSTPQETDPSKVALSSVNLRDKLTIGGVEYIVSRIDPLSSGPEIKIKDAQGNERNLDQSGSASVANDKLNKFGVTNYVPATSPTTGAFVLATTATSSAPRQDMFGSLTNMFTNNIPGIMGGGFANSALGGALVSAIIEMMMAQDNQIQYSDTFAVPKVEITGVSLESQEGIALEVGDVTYDFDAMDSGLAESTSVGEYSQGRNVQQSGFSSQGAQGTGYQGLTNRTQPQQFGSGILFNPQALTATQGLTEIQELSFRNPSQLSNKTPYEPFSGVLTVTAEENVYKTSYDYQAIKKAAKARKEYKEPKPIFDIPIIGDLFKAQSETVAEITEEDLEIEETRDYTKKFHLLFNSYEYYECGPNTYPCPGTTIGNCTVGTKTGSTGLEAAPKLKLSWNWSDISANTCDEDNPDYVYCDSTQFTISVLRKVQDMKQFFTTSSLSQCPQAIDVAGTKTQDLKDNALDVGITRIQMKPTTEGATMEAIVQTNNNLQMSGKLSFNLTREDGTSVSTTGCQNIEKTFTSEQVFSCEVKTSEIGSGRFNVVAVLQPTLCDGCQNTDTTNDSIAVMLVIGSANVQECSEYTTKYDYFQKVLAANNALNTTGTRILKHTNYTVNLVRDGFSADFKNDFDAYSKTLANAPPFYTVEGLSELFRNDKFEVKWPTYPGAWEAGKYNARIVVEFEDQSWVWDSNNSNIKKITVVLEPWGLPEPYHSIYNVGFNGMVGIETDNGRQGYGASYTQTSEKPLYINSTLQARPDPNNNGVSNAIVSVQNDFYTMNTSRRGNVLTVQRTGQNVMINLSPSIAVPMVLDITRNTARDAYAYYVVEVDGRPQTDLGATFMTWNGIGQGCYDFVGAGMGNWSNSADEKSDSADQGYGLRWNNSTHAGTVSLFGTFYVPQESSSIFRITSQSESANVESPQGTGQIITIAGSDGIKSLADVFEKVKSEEICVVGGEYFWNSGKVYEPLQASIQGKENTCIAQ